jgi:hypothetical protein
MTPVVPLKNLQNADQQPYKALETLHWCPEGTVADFIPGRDGTGAWQISGVIRAAARACFVFC